MQFGERKVHILQTGVRIKHFLCSEHLPSRKEQPSLKTAENITNFMHLFGFGQFSTFKHFSSPVWEQSVCYVNQD